MAVGSPAPILIALPQGLCVSGITTWAIRLANGLARLGRGAGVILHPEPPGIGRVEAAIDPAVAVFSPTGMPGFEQSPGDLSPFLASYRDAVGALSERWGGPVVVSPNLHGDCYGVGAALAREAPEGIRLIGWQHSDIEYDARVLEHYEPVLTRFVAVSDRIEHVLRERLGRRAGDVANVPYGVEVADTCPVREGLSGRPVRLIYTGRIEHQQKRIMALPQLSRELARRRIAHELTVVGDGPACVEFDRAAQDVPGVRRLAPASPRAVGTMLERADAFVLASRYEGLSVAMLEAMARGCVPVVTRVESGLLQAIEPDASGIVANAGPDADEQAAAAALADAVERLIARDPAAMSRAAWGVVRDRFSIERHVARVATLLDEVAGSPSRRWPADRACAFSSAGPGGSGSVPVEGAERMEAVLRSLAGRRVVIHGTGQHTLQLREVILSSPARVVAFADDDRARHGGSLWDRPIVAPVQAGATGATDVLISSWMHEDAVWSRRAVYERQGLCVRRVYASSGAEPATHA